MARSPRGGVWPSRCGRRSCGFLAGPASVPARALGVSKKPPCFLRGRSGQKKTERDSGPPRDGMLGLALSVAPYVCQKIFFAKIAVE